MKATTADRLKEVMKQYELRQIDILNRAEPFCKQLNVKLGRNDLSQYVSGKVSPGQEKLTVLALALGVSETWLMGYDVPMERNNYEDQNTLRFDAEFEEARNIIESAGYLISLSDDSNDIIIKTHDNDIVACMHDYELVGKYESLQHKHISITAETLVEDSKIQTWLNREYAFDCQLKALGWTYKILFEADPINEGHGRAVALFKNKDISFRASMKDCDSFINDAESFFKERLQQLLKKSMKQMFVEKPVDDKPYLLPRAAHQRTDLTEDELNDVERNQLDDDIMNDPNF